MVAELDRGIVPHDATVTQKKPRLVLLPQPDLVHIPLDVPYDNSPVNPDRTQDILRGMNVQKTEESDNRVSAEMADILREIIYIAPERIIPNGKIYPSDTDTTDNVR